MITGVNESKTFTYQISCKCKCKFDGKKRNSNLWCNNNKCRDYKIIFGILLHVAVKMENI